MKLINLFHISCAAFTLLNHFAASNLSWWYGFVNYFHFENNIFDFYDVEHLLCSFTCSIGCLTFSIHVYILTPIGKEESSDRNGIQSRNSSFVVLFSHLLTRLQTTLTVTNTRNVKKAPCKQFPPLPGVDWTTQASSHTDRESSIPFWKDLPNCF